MGIHVHNMGMYIINEQEPVVSNLNAKQAKFLTTYIRNGGNIRQASLAAGYDESYGSKLLKSEKIQQALSEERTVGNAMAGTTFAECLREIDEFIDNLRARFDDGDSRVANALHSALATKMKMCGHLEKDNKTGADTPTINIIGLSPKKTRVVSEQ